MSPVPTSGRLFVIGPALDQSSYSRVLENILRSLSAHWQIQQLAVNYRGQPVQNAGWQILPNPHIGDRYGMEQAQAHIRSFQPDVVLIFNCFTVLPRYLSLRQQLSDLSCAWLAYCPLLGKPLDDYRVKGLACFDAIVALTPNVRDYFHGTLQALQHQGHIQHAPPVLAIPHGFDRAIFQDLNSAAADRQGQRRALKRLRFPQWFASASDHELDHSFIVLNANRNEPRKRMETTIKGFAAFAQNKPSNVKLYLHMADGASSAAVGPLQAQIHALGMAERVCIASSIPGQHPQISDAQLNQLYNACEVGINTAASEGWGMISFEHAATGAPQLVPKHGVCLELWQDSAELLALDSEQPGAAKAKCVVQENEVSVASVAAALNRLYTDRDHYQNMARRSQHNALRPEYQWNHIAQRWHDVMRLLAR